MTSKDNPVDIPEGPYGYKFVGYYNQKIELGATDDEIGDAVRLINENGYKEDVFDNKYFSSNSVIYARWIEYFPDKEFEYSGEIEEIELVPGTYKLEVWGAQGGDKISGTTSYGGYGGYASGLFSTDERMKIYVAVGEIGGGAKGWVDGGDILNNNGGWNGRRLRLRNSWTTVVVECHLFQHQLK